MRALLWWLKKYVKLLNKSGIKQSFSRSAKTYDSFAAVQKEIAHELIFRVLSFPLQTQRILDVGAGTGNCALLLYEQFPSSSIYAFDIAKGMADVMYRKVCGSEKTIRIMTADAQTMPYVDNSFNLVVSSLVYQWVEDRGAAFQEVSRITGPGGIFAFAVPGKNTFKELKESYNAIMMKKHTLPALHTFFSKDEIKKYLPDAGFVCKMLDVITIKRNYPDVKTFLRNLKNIGAQNAHITPESNGIGKKRPLNNLMDFYQSQFCNEFGIYATYEILLAIGIKG